MKNKLPVQVRKCGVGKQNKANLSLTFFAIIHTVYAPENDVRFLKRLLSYEKVDPEVAQAAIKKFLRHLWYLGEEMIFLSLFDNRVEEKTKRQMVEVFKTENPPCFVKENLTPIESRQIKAIVCKDDIENLSLEHFVTARSIRFFEILNIDSKWLLEIDPMKWEDDKSYQEAKHVVKGLKVVNDVAERGVFLVQEYNQIHTVNEEQKQALFQSVQKHRKQIPNANKKTISNAISKK